VRLETAEIRRRVRDGQYVYSLHADQERQAEGLTFAQIREALLNAERLEEYADTGRGESWLMVGFAGKLPIHVVCGRRRDQIALITVYVPRLPKFSDPWTRGGQGGA